MLSVTASVLFGNNYMLPILTEFLDANPMVSGRAVFVDRVVNIVDEGIDVAIRIGHLPDSSYSAVRVGTVRRVVCGAPAYFERHGVPQKPADLADHRIIASTGSWSSLDWRFGQDEKIGVTITPRLSCSTYEAIVGAAVQGWGLARPLSYQIAGALESGALADCPVRIMSLNRCRSMSSTPKDAGHRPRSGPLSTWPSTACAPTATSTEALLSARGTAGDRARSCPGRRWQSPTPVRTSRDGWRQAHPGRRTAG